MKILYFTSLDNQSYMSQWQKIHFIDELYIHKVTFDFFDFNKYETLEQANELLIRKLKGLHDYDLFFSAVGTDKLFKETMEVLKNIPIPKLLICFDNLQVPYMHKEIAPYFDLVWLTSHETEYMFKKWGCKTIFMPYAANPYFFTNKFSKEIKKIGFIGTPYGTRTTKINNLLDNNIECNLYFSNKKNIPSQQSTISFDKIVSILQYSTFFVGRKVLEAKVKQLFNNKFIILKSDNPNLTISDSVSFEEMNILYSNLSLNLNITELWNTYLIKNPIYKLHLRTFEIPMCAGIEITTYNKELAQYFEEGKEIIFYNSEEEFIEKTRFYLSDKNLKTRMKIRELARKRSESEHTWWNRFSNIFNILNIKL